MNHAPHTAGALRLEAPYILLVALVLALSAAAAIAPPRGARPPAEAPEAALSGASSSELPRHRLAAFCWYDAALALFLGLGGLAVLAAAVWKMARGEPLVRAAPAPAARWVLWDVVKLFAVQQAALALMALLCSDLIPGAGRPRILIYLANVIASFMMVAVGLHVVLADRGETLPRVGFTLRSPGRFIRLGVLACVGFWPIHFAIAVAQAWVVERWGLRMPQQDIVRLIQTAADPWLLATLVFSAVVVAPVAEEFLFRALLIPALRKWMRPWLAIAVSAILFSMAHDSLQAALVIFTLGLALGYLYDRARSLIAPVVFHAAFNLSQLIFIFSSRP